MASERIAPSSARTVMGSSSQVTVKREPQDLPLRARSIASTMAAHNRFPSSPPIAVKSEPVEASHSLINRAATQPTASPLRSPVHSQISSTIKSEPQPEPQPDIKPNVQDPPSIVAAPTPNDDPPIEIDYTPENALAEGVEMAKRIEGYIREIDLGTELRKDVWLRNIEGFKNQGMPQTMIAVCGATGAGKSSLLNAVLDDNIVPTSGMRACTAVVTEIRHHEEDNIVAEVEFLSRAEWESELEILRSDLTDESGRPKRTNDLRTEAGIAWHKIHAVYPTLRPEYIIGMTPAEIVDSDPELADRFDTIERLERPNSEEFGVEITKYIDSKDQKRGRGKSKKADKDKDKSNEAALWPLIRMVRVWCKSRALSCGAVLVDLPGVADANMARSNIAKEYMKKCDCIWIVAPITRAVDDKTAKDLLGEAFKTQLLMDGNYDAGTITFIATKTDDLSCAEVIAALGLDDDPGLIELRIEWKAALNEVDECETIIDAKRGEIEENESQRKMLRAIIAEYKEHRKALKARKPFVPYLTAPGYQAAHKERPTSKRKRRGVARKGSGKRARVDDDEDMQLPDFDYDTDMGEPMDIDNIDDLFCDEPEELEEDEVPETDIEAEAVEEALDRDVIVIDDSDDEVVIIPSSDESEAPKAQAKVTVNAVATAPVTQASLTEIIGKKDAQLKDLMTKKQELKNDFAKAKVRVGELRKVLVQLQKDKNAFCSTNRNEYSKEVLKQDFREGLKQLDQAEEEAKNPETFDPAVELRDYSAMDLPVFTCSSRDYIRIKRQVKGDGEPSCFTKIEDTEIPALQEWCHKLTANARERSARYLLNGLATFLQSVRSFVDEMQGINISDRVALADAWESNAQGAKVETGDALGLTRAQPVPPPEPATPIKPLRGRRQSQHIVSSSPMGQDLSGMAQRAQALLAQDRYTSQQNCKSVSFRLRQSLQLIVEDCIKRVKQAFHDGIEERCRSGAEKAKFAAIETSDKLAESIHWNTYRAILRHQGEFKGDLNADLVGPMTREMAPSWARVFDSESDLFTPMMQAGRIEISKLLNEIQTSAPPGLKDRCQEQCFLALTEAYIVIDHILHNIKAALTSEQKDISRSLTPHVKKELHEAYSSAAAQTGPGSVLRQKKMFHDYVELSRSKIFSDGADALFRKLEQAAESIGILLRLAFTELSEKVEVSISVLWDIPTDNKAEMMKRRELVKVIHDMLRQLEVWLAAIQASATRTQIAKSTKAGLERGASSDPTEDSDAEDSEMTDANTSLEEPPLAGPSYVQVPPASGS